MSDRPENDELLQRLSAEDPASGTAEAPGEREAVRARATELLTADSPAPVRHSMRPRLAIAAVLVVLAVGVVLSLTLGGSSSGPEPALAIEKSKQWVTLRLKDPTASDEEMNQELADAGIDRVRVHSVPGAPKAVGTFAGWTEFQPRCKGWSGRFGSEVDMAISHPYNRANRHGAEDQFDLTIPSHSGVLYSQEVGTPYSKSIARLPADDVNDPRSAAKLLVPIRPRSTDDAPDADQIGPDQLVALGGVFAEYGDAINSGETSCPDFGLKPEPKHRYKFPPPGNGWVVLHVSGTEAGARRMDRALRAGNIDGAVRLLPAPHGDIGHYLGFESVPPLPKHSHAAGNEFDVAPDHPPPGSEQHGSDDVALRRSAFNAFPDVRWIFYVGRAPDPGESPALLSPDGPVDADAALKRGCPGMGMVMSTKEGKSCLPPLALQVPAPPKH
jgi:hypothetical protein